MIRGGFKHTPRIIGKGGAFSLVSFVSVLADIIKIGWIGSGRVSGAFHRIESVAGGPDYVCVRLGLGGRVCFSRLGRRDGIGSGKGINGMMGWDGIGEGRVGKTQDTSPLCTAGSEAALPCIYKQNHKIMDGGIEWRNCTTVGSN